MVTYRPPCFTTHTQITFFERDTPTFFWFENLVRPCAHLTDSRCRDVPTLPWCGDVHNTSLFFFAVITLFRFKSVENIRFGLGCDGDVPTPLLWWRTFSHLNYFLQTIPVLCFRNLQSCRLVTYAFLHRAWSQMVQSICSACALIDLWWTHLSRSPDCSNV